MTLKVGDAFEMCNDAFKTNPEVQSPEIFAPQKKSLALVG